MMLFPHTDTLDVIESFTEPFDVSGSLWLVATSKLVPKMATQSGGLKTVWRSWSARFPLCFLWFDPGSELWFLSFMPVIDGDEQEWDSASLHACFDKDTSTCWCPWNAAEASHLRITTLADYEHWKRRGAEKKLLQWQSWWHAGGQNDLLEYPPQFPVPPNPPSRITLHMKIAWL